MANIFFDIGHQNNNTRNDRSKVLFLEGTDDAYFLDKLLEMAGASPSDVGIVTVGGIGEFPARIKGFTKTPQFTTKKTKGVAIIRDADEDFARTQTEMSTFFQRQFGVSLNHGDVIVHDGLVLGLFLLPGQDLPGDLERLCLSTVEGTHLEQQSEALLAALQPRPLDHAFKRKAQVYLAGYNGELCRGAGYGFKSGQFNENHGVLRPLLDFIERFLSTQQAVAVAA